MSVKNALGYDNFPIPVGALLPYCSSITPYGYLVCDGTTYNQSDYPDLFRVLDGVGYGQTSTTFDVPNLVGEYIRGTSVNAGTIDPGQSGGETTSVSLVVANIPPFSTDGASIVFTTSPGTTVPVITSASNQGTDVDTVTSQFVARNEDETTHQLSITSLTSSVSYTNATQLGLSLTASLVPRPSHYELVYLIRAFY